MRAGAPIRSFVPGRAVGPGATTMNFLQAIRWLHVLASVTALATLAVPLVARKGGGLHRRVGRVYVRAMAAAIASSVVASGWRLALDPVPGRRVRAVFFLYVALLAGTSLSAGMRALATKGRAAPSRHPWDVGLPALLVAGAVALALFGARTGVALFVGFAPVGLLIGAGQLAYWLRPPQTRTHFVVAHMNGMVASGIAALTAFLVQSAPRLHLGQFSLLVWLTPAVVGATLLRVFRARDRRRVAAGAGDPARA
jgi:hypothetical protein